MRPSVWRWQYAYGQTEGRANRDSGVLAGQGVDEVHAREPRTGGGQKVVAPELRPFTPERHQRSTNSARLAQDSERRVLDALAQALVCVSHPRARLEIYGAKTSRQSDVRARSNSPPALTPLRYLRGAHSVCVVHRNERSRGADGRNDRDSGAGGLGAWKLTQVVPCSSLWEVSVSRDARGEMGERRRTYRRVSLVVRRCGSSSAASWGGRKSRGAVLLEPAAAHAQHTPNAALFLGVRLRCAASAEFCGRVVSSRIRRRGRL
ncbi:hypothetical protein C8R43DRAFT_1126032 [Mycena crocata]|nr:hypothetical protein C8R43DRAFT_1126032 [Mycena crocata]